MGRVDHSARTRKALDRKLSLLEPLEIQTPPGGWIRSIRESLRMTQYQLADRMGVNQRTVNAMETSESKGKIQMDSLKRAAEALNCDLVYGLIPRQPLEEMVRSRAKLIANSRMASINQTMLLENQLPESQEEVLQGLITHILNEDVSLWESSLDDGI